MVDTGRNPYQLFSNPLPTPPSSGTVGDFLRSITTPAPVASTTQIPTAPVVQAPTPTNNTDRIKQYNEAQIAGGLVPQELVYNRRPDSPLLPQRPALANFLPGKFQDNQSARIPAPQGYTPPTAEDIATSDAVSRAYFAPYRRQAQLENYKLETERLKALGSYAAGQPKPPTLKDQLYKQASEALAERYKLDEAAANEVRAEGWFVGDADHERARAAARLKARKAYIDDLVKLPSLTTRTIELPEPNDN